MLNERISGTDKPKENPFEVKDEDKEDEERSYADLAEDSNNYPSGYEPDEDKNYE